MPYSNVTSDVKPFTGIRSEHIGIAVGDGVGDGVGEGEGSCIGLDVGCEVRVGGGFFDPGASCTAGEGVADGFNCGCSGGGVSGGKPALATSPHADASSISAHRQSGVR